MPGDNKTPKQQNKKQETMDLQNNQKIINKREIVKSLFINNYFKHMD